LRKPQDTNQSAIDVSIIIVNWNTRDLLAQCLLSVYETVQGLEFEASWWITSLPTAAPGWCSSYSPERGWWRIEKIRAFD
jgi:hypothetical protein